MAKGRIRLLSTIPGPANLRAIVGEFCRKEGLVTAFADSAVRTLASFIPEESAAEAISFGGLARRFASLCGDSPLPVAHDGHVVAAMAAACEDLPDGSPFDRTAYRPGLHRALVETLHELGGYGLDADEYESLAAASDAEPGRDTVGPKLASLAHVEREATETLRQLGRSFGRQYLRDFSERVPERGANLGRVLVVAGSAYNPLSVELLKWAVSHGAQITVVIYRHAGKSDLYRGSRQTAAALGIDAEQVGLANQLLQHLFSESESAKPDLKCAVVSAGDPLAEAEWALRGCLRRHGDGVPYGRMAVYVRDPASYGPLIEAASRRLGVPVRMWRRAPLLTNSFARVTRSALEFCSANDVRSLMPLATTSYVGLDFQTRQALKEALRQAHSSRGEQWRSMRDWVIERAEDFKWLQALLDWREQAIANPAELQVWIGRVRELMMILPPEETIPAASGRSPGLSTSSEAAGRDAIGGGSASERDLRAQYVLQQSLNQIASVRRVRNPRSMTLREFTRYAGEIWSQSDVSIPSRDTGVLVTAQAEALPELRCLFVLGMLEGVFPRRRTEDPILSDFDRQAISSLRLSLPGREPGDLPLSTHKAEAERDEFYTMCSSASDEIVFSYPETGEDRDNVPAFYLDEVERALGGIAKMSRLRDELTPEPAECQAESDRELAEALASPERGESLPLEFSSPFTAKSLERDPELGLKPRELREALQCPFSFFARRTLGIRPERLRARWFALAKLPQRAGLAAKESVEEGRAALEEQLDRQLEEMYSDVPDWEIGLLRSGGRRLIREWVQRESIARRIWPKEAVRSNVRFGDEGLRDRLPRIVKLTGEVAAMSRSGLYSVVHLVETSGPTRGYGPMNDLSDQDKLYYGIHFLASWGKDSACALEVETMAGERYLMLLPRLAGVNFPAQVQEGLRVLDLAGLEDSGGTRAFLEDVKRLAKEAAVRIEKVDVRALRGDHCLWCDYGELCRQSLDFGEEDSPFVEDF